ncbi:MAG: TonB-dependent receptor plug domain-containing protein [Crocinitomicaceae bacterium]|nr:TonB-dependent receptor plug domain-containing protein [Crocinitomicaceae bacterium]
MKFFLLNLIFYCFLLNAFSQEKTTSLDEVYVNSIKDSVLLNSLNQRYSKSDLQAFSPEDIGSMTQKFSGVSLKNYGGIGGLKTISFRGITGNHTAILVDGFSIQNNQVGQVDLGAIQSENVESISLSSSVTSSKLAPVSSVLQGNSLVIFTFENSFLVSNQQLRFTEKIGSFGQSDSYLSYKRKMNRGFVSSFMRFRTFQGDYNYNFKNVSLDYSGKRSNNDLNEGSAGISFGEILGKRMKIASNYVYYGSDKGLPGAVILYNESANQRLNTQNHQWNTEFIVCGSKTSSRFYASLQMNALRYLDPSYLNSQGGLTQLYQNKLAQLGYSFNHIFKDSLINWFGGIEHTSSQLSEVGTGLNPQRQHSQGLTGVSIKKMNYHTSILIGNHQVFNFYKDQWNYKNAFVGAVEVVGVKQHKWLIQPRLQMKRTFRMPSFGELYYNQIGNVSLLPEIVNQGNIGLTYSLFKNSMQISFDAYSNLVENKILAIPTKNLFVWSMQNVGKVLINGIDVILKKSWKINERSTLDNRMSYSLQYALDYSDISSVTYKSQIAYIPKNTANLDFMYTYNQKWGVSFTNIVTSERFALNENIDANRLSGFVVSDFNTFYKCAYKKVNEFRLSFTIKNVFNTSYAYIRYYVMPGVNYLFTLSYEFN